MIREFLPGDLGGGVYRGAAFIDHHYQDPGRKTDGPDKRLCFPACCAVAYRYCLNGKSFTEIPDF